MSAILIGATFRIRGYPSPTGRQVSPRPREMAISPVRIISTIPNGRTISSKASILSVVPVISTMSDLRVTSTTLPRKISTAWSTSARWEPSAPTLNSASSRATVPSGSRSRILITLTSLCSCLVTWSIGCSAPSSVSVMREMSSSSVGPTDSVSMLNPRRAKSPAMRVSTPGLFSTRIDSVCLRPVCSATDASSSSRLSSSFVPGSPISAHHVPRRRAGGDHGIDVLLRRHADVDEHRPLGGQRRAHVVDQRRLVREAQPGGPVGLGQLDEVRILAHVDMRVALVPEQLLPLADHAEVAVVHDEHLDGDALLGARRELLHVHLHRAVAGDADDGRVRAAHLRTHRGRQAEAHRPQATRGDPPARPLEVEVLGRPHLVLADVGRDDGVAAGGLVERLDHPLRA